MRCKVKHMKTPKFLYVLEKSRIRPERDEPEMIHVHVRYGYSYYNSKGRRVYEPVKLSLQEKILPKNFGLEKDNFVYNVEVFEKYSKRNRGVKNRMMQFEEVVLRTAGTYPINVIPSKKEFKKKLLEELGRIQQIDFSRLSILDFVEEEIVRYEHENAWGTEGSLDEDTISTYRTIRTLVKEYESATSEVLTLENLDLEKYKKFWDVLDAILRDEIQIKDKIRSKAQSKQWYGYLVNSIRKYQDALIKTINNAADKYKVRPSLNTKNAALKLKKANSSKDFYISEEELDLILKTDVKHDQGLQLAKDFLVVSCFTGMRYQSMNDSTSQSVNEEKSDGYKFKYFLSRQNKTQTEVFMPIMKPVMEVINRHGGKVPKWHSNGDMNKKLKVFAESVGLDTPVTETLVTYKFGKVEVQRPKFELLSTHDGRKSFITNLAKLRANQAVVDSMTHPDKKPTNPMNKVYIKTSLMDKAKMFVDEIQKVNSSLYVLD